ncbi:tripartite motif-containing protein 16-like isoform 2-T2 [Pholidichthys leucotaenia]
MVKALFFHTIMAEKNQQHSGGSQSPPKRLCSYANTPGSVLCSKHQRPRNVYCYTDNQIVCEQCTSAEHGGHRLGWVWEERRRKQEELNDFQTKFKKIFKKQEKKWENMGKMLAQIQEEAIKTDKDCEAVIVGVIDSLQKLYHSVEKLIAAQREQSRDQVRISLQNLEEWPSLKLLCEEEKLFFQENSEDPLLPFELTRRSVEQLGEQLGKQLEEFCDKEIDAVSQTASRSEQQESGGEAEECDASTSNGLSPKGLFGRNKTKPNQKAEPKTRDDFLKYACELSLDPITAHEDLIVSDGDKKVKLCPQNRRSPGIRDPERFLLRRQVLCREGLQAKQCYYEIEVEGDKAEIALTYKGIDRKSCTVKSAFGGNPKSWSLDRSVIYSVSHNGERIDLPMPPKHRRIGVYLKFEEGTLSFYEVSDTMTLLYKAEDKFTEPLYPGFWLGEKCCIRICDLRPDTL